MSQEGKGAGLRVGRGRGCALLLALALVAGCGSPAPPEPPGPSPPASAPAQVGQGREFVLPESIKVDRDGSLLVADATGGSLYRVDPATGDRRRLYPPGEGLTEESPRDATRAPDGSLYVLLESQRGCRVARLDEAGRLLPVSGSGAGKGPAWQAPFRVEALGSRRLAVADPEGDSLYLVDARTGDRSLLSGPERGEGPPFGWITDLHRAEDGSLLVVDESGNQVLRVDPDTGDRAVAADLANPKGPAVMAPAGLGPGGPGKVLVTEPDFSRVFEVDLKSGVQSVKVRGSAPGAPVLVPMDAAALPGGGLAVSCSRGPNLLVVDGQGRRVLSGTVPSGEGQELAPSALASGGEDLFYFTDPTVPGVGAYHPESGELTWISGPDRGSGPAFRSPTGLARADDGRLFVTDRRVGLLEVDPASGNRRLVLPDGSGTEGSPSRLRDVETLPGLEDVLVVSYKPREIFRVDPSSGRVRPLHPKAAPGTPDLEDPNRLARAARPGKILVGSSEESSIFLLDPETGRLELVTGPDRGQGPLSSMQDSMALASDGTLYFGNSLEGNVVRVGPEGDRTMVGGRDLVDRRDQKAWTLRGTGPRPLHIRDLATLPGDRLLIADPTVGGFLEMDPATGNRRRLEVHVQPAPAR